MNDGDDVYPCSRSQTFPHHHQNSLHSQHDQAIDLRVSTTRSISRTPRGLPATQGSPASTNDVTNGNHTEKTMSQPQSSAETVKTRILIISDTHTAPLVDPSGNNEPALEVAFRAPLPAADVLLHCGDLTMMGYLDEYEGALEMLGSIDAPLKLVIAGNHDLSLDEEFYLGQSRGRPLTMPFPNGQRMHLKKFDPDMPRKAKEMWTGEKAKAKGVTYLEEGVHEFVLQNGAKLTVR